MPMAVHFPAINYDARFQSSWAMPVQRKVLAPPEQIDWRDGCNRSSELNADDLERRFWSSWQPFDRVKNQDGDLPNHEKLPDMSIGAHVALECNTERCNL
jgi:hypothetical protein